MEALYIAATIVVLAIAIAKLNGIYKRKRYEALKAQHMSMLEGYEVYSVAVNGQDILYGVKTTGNLTLTYCPAVDLRSSGYVREIVVSEFEQRIKQELGSNGNL